MTLLYGRVICRLEIFTHLLGIEKYQNIYNAKQNTR